MEYVLAHQRSIFNRYLNNFSWFYITHMTMTVTFITLLIIHPWPGKRSLPASRRQLNCTAPAMSNGGTALHGTTWMYLCAGVTVYAVERILRSWRCGPWNVRLSAVRLHPGNVFELRLVNPRRTRQHMARRFRFVPGQYCYINIPEISVMEWHPFSLTSSPYDDFISFHIEAAGDWTKALQSIICALIDGVTPNSLLCHQAIPDQASRHQLKYRRTAIPRAFTASAEIVELQDAATRPPRLKPPKISLDGPFGAPGQHYRHYEVLLLVGSGVGITPFSSVLRTLVAESRQAKCHSCGKVNKKLFAPRQVYFYWVTKEQRAPMWLRTTLEAIRNDPLYTEFLEIHVHFTGAAQSDDLCANIVKVAQDLYHREHGIDILSGCRLPLPVAFGRPDWDRVFPRVCQRHPGQLIGTFYCGGNPVLARTLKGLSRTYSKARPAEATENLAGHFPAVRIGHHDDAQLRPYAGHKDVVKKTKFDFYKEIF
ncbi:hypothetical protein WJX84_007627 [Apatococcus fuscideae]|uniref:FAD-binding FR-type domain-containing protein n=1 Tax=Apatococcus fuscideae TaxID=2026836 RepID=A0AAW1T3F9_9CHLO